MTDYDMKPRRVSAAKLDRLAEWSLRKPTIALMGEFSAGKSTLLNLLLGQSILPTQVTATRMPPVWLRYGDAESYRVDRDGKQHPVDIKSPGSIPVKDTRFVRVYVKSEMLRNCDLMDTPGISDPNIPTDAWIRAIGYANAVLWCTHAGQAWRESERSAWEALPMRLRKTSLLLITRADKIINAVDRDKIDRRMQRETSQLFDGRHFVSLTDAAKARAEQNDAAWAASGAGSFMESLNRIIEGVGIERSYLLSRYQIDEHAAAASSYARPMRAPMGVSEPVAVVAPKVPEPEVRPPEVVAEVPVAPIEMAAPAPMAEPEPVTSIYRPSMRSLLRDQSDPPVPSPMAQEPEVDPEIQFDDEAEPEDQPETEAEPEPVNLLRPARVRPEGHTPVARPDRSSFEDRIAELKRLAAEEAALSGTVAPVVEPVPVAEEGLRALRDAFAAEPDDIEPPEDAELLADEAEETVVFEDDDSAEVEDEPLAASTESRDEAPEPALVEDVAFQEFEEVAVVEDEAEPADLPNEVLPEDDEVMAEEVEPLPMVAAAPAAVPVADEEPAPQGDDIDQLVSLLSSAAHAAPTVVSTPPRVSLVPSEPVAAAAPDSAMNAFAVQEVEAIRETWRDMQVRYNIAAMPRLAQAMTALVDGLAPVKPEPVAPVAEVEAAPVEVVVPAEDTEVAAGNRRWVRGLF